MKSINNIEDFQKFSSPEEVEKWVERNYTKNQLNKFNLSLNLEEPIALYKGSGYQRMNGILRAKTRDKGIKLPHDIISFQEQLSGMKAPGDMVATRFAGLGEAIRLFRLTIFKKVVVFDSFLSTTLLKDYYSMSNIKNGRVPISIYIPKGTPGMYIPEVNPDLPEFEFLIPYGVMLKRIGSRKYLVVSE